MRFVFACFVMLAAGCADRFVTEGHALGNHVWFAEVRDPSSGDAETRLIVCNVSASPPCVRLQPRDLRSIEQFKAWLATDSDAAAMAPAQAARTAPVAPDRAPVAPIQPSPSQPSP